MANRGVAFLKQIFNTQDVKKRLSFTFFILIVYRFLAAVPLPAVNLSQVTAGGNSPLTSVYTMVTGGRLDSPTLLAIGLGAYINASIILQLLGSVIPKLDELQKDGERGRAKITQYTRYLTLPISLLQGFGIYVLIKNSFPDLIVNISTLEVTSIVLTIATGSIILMWISELLTERGIGNGASLIIALGIISSLPTMINYDLDSLADTNRGLWWFVVLGFLLIIFLIVYVNEAIRKIPIQYARRARGMKSVGGGSSYLPLKVNAAGVMPVIFAFSMVFFVQFIFQFLAGATQDGTQIHTIFNTLYTITLPGGGYYWAFLSFEFILIILFTFFYTFIVIKPSDTAENLQKNGGFVPGIRPGKPTEKYISDILTRLTVIGAFFLAFIAVLPSVGRTDTHFAIFTLGGTSLLIIVNVFLDSIRQVNSMMVTRSYESYE